MCQTCGCAPCAKCGMEIKNGFCSGCQKQASQCTCSNRKTQGTQQARQSGQQAQTSQKKPRLPG